MPYSKQERRELRAHFAGQALGAWGALHSSNSYGREAPDKVIERVADRCVAIADALIARLEATETATPAEPEGEPH